MRVVVPGFWKLDVNFEPEHRLLGMNFTGASVDRDVEVLDPNLALSREWAEEPR